MKRLLLSIITIILLTPVFAGQEIVAFHLTSETGLPDSNIRNFWQDSLGYVYLFGRYQTYRYDGYDYHKLTQAENDSIRAPKVSRGHRSGETFRDNLGNLMQLLPNGDLLYKDEQTNQKLQFHVVDPHLFQLTERLMCTVITDRKRGLIWVTSNGGGLTLYDCNNNTVRHISRNDPQPLINSDYIVAAMQDLDGNIWVSGEYYGVTCLKVRQVNYEIINISQNDSEKGREVRMLTRLDDGRILVADMEGNVWQSTNELRTLQKLVLDGKNYISACLDYEGRLWLGSREDGISIDGRYYGEGRTDCILKDNKGRMWTCGLRGPLKLVSFENGVYSEQIFLNDIADLDPRVMLQDHQGLVWVGTKQGLYVFSPDRLIANPQSYEKVLDAQVMCLYETKDHTLWIGTAGSGAYYSVNNGKAIKGNSNTLPFKQLTHAGGLANDIVTLIVENGLGYLVFGTENGCSLMAQNNGKIYNRYFSDNRLRNIFNERCAVILGDGRMAMGSFDGIVVAGKPTEETTRSHPVRITGMEVNGVEWNVSNSTSSNSTSFDHTQNSLTFSFSNLDFGQRHQFSYLCRLEGYDRQWTSLGTDHTITYKDLPPGTYTLHVKTSEDASAEQTLTFRILPPWWRTWWAYLLYALAVAVIAFVVFYQVRRVIRLRRAVAVEKELTAYKLKFFTNISHEFRTPLTLIQGSMDRLKALPNTPTAAQAPLSSMQRNVDRMLRLINQLLEFRRMQNNKLSLSLEKTNIVAFIYNIVQSFRDTAEQQHIGLSFTPSMKELDIFIDRGFIDKSVYNLLSNAFKYTPKGGHVEVNLKKENEQLKIIVADTGIGVPENMRQMIFNRYQRGQAGRDSLGIGLNLTAELIRTHHGTIRCEGREGNGSIFTITLPANISLYKESDFLKQNAVTNAESKVERQGFTDQIHERISLIPMNDHRILVVEDNPEIRAFLQQELSHYFQVETAANGKEALKVLTPTLQLVITDVMMPEMNGYELIRQLRKHESTRHLPVIMLTAINADDQILKGFELGADAYITKPFSLPLLLLQVRNLLQRSDRMKDAYSQEVKPTKKINPEIIMQERDQRLLVQLSSYVDSHLAAPDLSVDHFAEEMGYGRTTFYQRLKALTGQTPNDYIKERRLQRAYELLNGDERITVAEVAYQVGMATPQYLSTTFKKRFGITPTQFQKGVKSEE